MQKHFWTYGTVSHRSWKCIFQQQERVLQAMAVNQFITFAYIGPPLWSFPDVQLSHTFGLDCRPYTYRVYYPLQKAISMNLHTRTSSDECTFIGQHLKCKFVGKAYQFIIILELYNFEKVIFTRLQSPTAIFRYHLAQCSSCLFIFSVRRSFLFVVRLAALFLWLSRRISLILWSVRSIHHRLRHKYATQGMCQVL